MTQSVVKTIVALTIVCPFIFMAKKESVNIWRYLLLFVGYYFFYSILLSAPCFISELKIFTGDWNWSGKIYAIVGSLLFYFLFKKVFISSDYLVLKQTNKPVKPELYAIIILFLANIVLFFLKSNTPERTEPFLFQITMPGLDEEMAFRGIMMGLLSNALKPKACIGSRSLGNPALIITSILFGLGHSFNIDNNWGFHQNWAEFIQVFAIGSVFGWMTIKSGSILMAILSHGLVNTLPYIIFAVTN